MDCPTLLQEVDRSMAAAYAEEIGAMYLETSAKEDLHVHDMFVQLSELFSKTFTAFVWIFFPLQVTDYLHHRNLILMWSRRPQHRKGQSRRKGVVEFWEIECSSSVCWILRFFSWLHHAKLFRMLRCNKVIWCAQAWFSGEKLTSRLLCIISQRIDPEFEAIRGHMSAHSFATGPATADPFISPLLLTMTPALSSK